MKDAVWNVKLYGGRGSTPVCEPAFQHFGGNTTCIVHLRHGTKTSIPTGPHSAPTTTIASTACGAFFC